MNYLKSKITPIVIIVCLVVMVATAPSTLAKLAVMYGMPQIALLLVRDEKVKAPILYELGRYGEADRLFAKIGRGATYDRGLSLAMTGDYRHAVAYFKAVQFADQWDMDARHNEEVLEQFIEPVIGESKGQGRITQLLQKAGIGGKKNQAGKNSNEVYRELYSPKKPLDAKTVAATQAWLDTLQDQPGEYLKKRLEAEYQRRLKTGDARENSGPPW